MKLNKKYDNVLASWLLELFKLGNKFFFSKDYCLYMNTLSWRTKQNIAKKSGSVKTAVTLLHTVRGKSERVSLVQGLDPVRWKLNKPEIRAFTTIVS